MACSRIPGVISGDGPWAFSRTPGPLGFNDQGDPNRCTLLGDTPGPLGLFDLGDPTLSRAMPGSRLFDGHQLRLADGTPLAMPTAAALANQKRAPWMDIAEQEAKQFKGETEATIQKTTNFATDVHTGQTSMVGGDHPWCAAFVNWCLMKAGYVVENESFADRAAAKGRAHGFYEVRGAKVKKGEKEGPMVRNPLYVKLDTPVYGAIAMVTNPGGHGHHVGFVWSKPRDNHVVLLGGNQSDRIRFSEFNVDAVKSTTVMKAGKKVVVPGKPDHLMFFVPASYEAYARTDTTLGTDDADTLNASFGIATGKGGGQESTR